MAGGLGRAMGGWDEMVFRTMVHDDAYIYDVVGLESEGTSADFQTGANSYLYGTRFMTWLCYTYGPGQVAPMDYSRREHQALFRVALQAGLRNRDGSTPGKCGSPTSGSFKKPTSPTFASIPSPCRKGSRTQTLGSVSRSYFDSKDNVIYAAIRYPAHMASIAAIHVDTGKIDELKDIKGPGALLRDVSYLGRARPQALLHHRQQRFARLECLRRGYPSLRTIIEGHSHRGPGVRCRGRLHLGRPAQQWLVRPGGISGAVQRNDRPPRIRIRQRHLRHRRLTRRPISDRRDLRCERQARSWFDFKSPICARVQERDPFEMLYDFEYNSPGNFVYSPDGRYLYSARPTIPARPICFATISRPRRWT